MEELYVKQTHVNLMPRLCDQIWPETGFPLLLKVFLSVTTL
jgi:hypothetical protein